MKLGRKLADCQRPRSISFRSRIKRINLFCQLIARINPPINILDVGGTQSFWDAMGFSDQKNLQFTLLNIKFYTPNRTNFRTVIGDATDMTCFRDKEFDIVFSNSVIEHVGNFDRQKKMASEIQRVGKRYFVQTPNFYFPIEPHYLLPGFHWLPFPIRVMLIRHFDLGWINKKSTLDLAQQQIRSIRMLTKKELLALFPGAVIYRERFLGIIKSFIVYKWD